MTDSFVYFLRSEDGLIKIGRSRLPLARLGEIVRSNGHAIELMGAIPGGKVLESALHVSFAYLRIPSDPSLGDGRTEWFSVDDALLSYIETNAQDLPGRGYPASYSYRVRIEKETTPALQDLAQSLSFVATTPGKYLGVPSPGSFLDALAAAYAADPDGVKAALKGIGVYNKDDTPAADNPA